MKPTKMRNEDEVQLNLNMNKKNDDVTTVLASKQCGMGTVEADSRDHLICYL